MASRARQRGANCPLFPLNRSGSRYYHHTASHPSRQGIPESRVCVVCDDTDVFALLIFYLNQKLQTSMIMQSPIQCRSCVDIKETVHTENHT